MGKQDYTKFASEVSFMSKMVVARALARIQSGAEVELDASGSFYIDDDVLEVINDFLVRAMTILM